MHSRIALSLSLAASLSACATLPSSGPTGAEIRNDIEASATQPPIAIVEVADAGALPPPRAAAAIPLTELTPPPTDMVGPGDVLNISIYEAGVTLFGGSGAPPAREAAAFDPGAKVQTLPPTRVDDNGDIVLPYAGRLRVVGKTVGEIQNQIRKALLGFSQNPQVIVTVRDVITNSIIVGGEVARPGRLVLQTNRETLSDVVALAGGYRGNAKDLTIRIFRQEKVVDVRMSDLVDNPSLDVRAYPGDRFTLVSNPRTYTILGASGRIEQVPFSRSVVSLAEAIATAGGPNPNFGNPAAVFIFRYVPSEDSEAKPVVYHVNMMKAHSYFLAQRFEMSDKDVLYFGNSEANQPTKVIQLISQLFAPIATVTSVVNLLEDSSN